MLLLLLWLFLLSYLSIVLDAKYYNSEEAITKRVEHLRQTCEKYRHEQQLLLDENIADPSANYVQNWATKFFICVPSENGAIPWNRFFRKIHNFDLKVSIFLGKYFMYYQKYFFRNTELTIIP